MCAMLSGLFIAGDNGRPPQAHKQKLVTLNDKGFRGFFSSDSVPVHFGTFLPCQFTLLFH